MTGDGHAENLARFEAEVRACRICRDAPEGAPLPHEPRPVLRISAAARILLCGQAPGTRVHASGRPFTDPSGDRLRAWMGVDEATFFDASRIAILPMGFCFPGLDAKGGDLPPRKECAIHWRARAMAALPRIELVLLVGLYAQRWHLGARAGRSLTETVRSWQCFLEPAKGEPAGPRHLPLPHPSWRNNAWLKRNPWFEAEVLPRLKREVAALL